MCLFTRSADVLQFSLMFLFPALGRFVPRIFENVCPELSFNSGTTHSIISIRVRLGGQSDNTECNLPIFNGVPLLQQIPIFVDLSRRKSVRQHSVMPVCQVRTGSPSTPRRCRFQ